MNDKPKTRVEASAPRATEHLTESQKKALDLQADAEHTDGREREALTRQIEKLGGSAKTNRRKAKC